MANKRILKKQVRHVCGDVAAECILASEFLPGVDSQKMREIIVELATLQDNILNNASFSFDKTPAQFESAKEYNKARRNYYAKAFASLKKEFNTKIEAIVKEMNSTLTAEQREENKKIAAAD